MTAHQIDSDDSDDSDESTFSEWYREGSALPVCHPIPYCSATITFPTPETIRWDVTNHKTGETSTETFSLVDREGPEDVA